MTGFVWGDPSTYATHCERCGEELPPSPRPLYLSTPGGLQLCRRDYYGGLAEVTTEHAKQFRPWQPAYWRWRRTIRRWQTETETTQ